MATPSQEEGEQIKAERQARNLSRPALAALSGVSERTIQRVEEGTGGARGIPALRRYLGLDDAGTRVDPPLSQATAEQLAAEFTRRLTDADRILKHSRLTRSTAPPGLNERRDSGVTHGPRGRRPARDQK